MTVAGSAARAADMPVKAAPVAPAAYNWTGIYGGIHAGYGMGMKDWTNSIFDFDVKGFLGGGQIGVNQQIGNWVIGIEADASWANLRGNQAVAFGSIGSNFVQSAFGSTSVNGIVTAAGRLGLAQDRWLVYVKAGAAWVQESHTFNLAAAFVFPGTPTVANTFSAQGRESRLGPLVGFGIEYALWGNWSFKTEYNFLSMPVAAPRLTGTQTLLGTTGTFATDLNIRQVFHLAKFGVNYRFGPEASPAIAPASPLPGYNWTGFYVGAQAAYGFGRAEWEGFAPDGRFDMRGAFAGGVTGANVQAGVLVAGVETEWMWAGVKGSDSFTRTTIAPQTTTFSSKIDWLSLNSVRIGFVAADRWLVYLKGGVALAQEPHLRNVTLVSPVILSVANLNSSALHTGHVAGVGVEHAFFGNWSAKLEYNYLGFGSQTVTGVGTRVTLPTPGPTAEFQRNTINEHMHLVKFGVNYKFTSGLADLVTAKY